jgi:hypothetical protein
MKYLFALWFVFCVFASFSFIHVEKHIKISSGPLKYSEGSYILELVSMTDKGIRLFPMAIYEDPNWSAAVCNTERENFIRDYGKLLEKHNLKITCAEYHPYRV